jgi:hypothetical protein
MKEKTNRKKAVSPEFIEGAANYKRIPPAKYTI